MPFFLYHITGEPGREQYTSVRPIRLAGQSGPLAKFSRKANSEQRIPFGWHAKADEIIATNDEIIATANKINRPSGKADEIIRLSGGVPSTQAIVIDLKPRLAGNVSLYRLLDVWGFLYDSWTPPAIRLQVLFADRRETNPLAFKNSFIDPGTDPSWVGEFLYVQGGVSKGTWNWGMVGRVNGALLWRDAFDFLTTALQRSI